MKISDRNTVQIRSYILNFIIVWPGYDNIGSATGLNKVVIDAALDHLSQASAQNQILLVRIKPINRDASGVSAFLGSRRVNANEGPDSVAVHSYCAVRMLATQRSRGMTLAANRVAFEQYRRASVT